MKFEVAASIEVYNNQQAVADSNPVAYSYQVIVLDPFLDNFKVLFYFHSVCNCHNPAAAEAYHKYLLVFAEAMEGILDFDKEYNYDSKQNLDEAVSSFREFLFFTEGNKAVIQVRIAALLWVLNIFKHLRENG